MILKTQLIDKKKNIPLASVKISEMKTLIREYYLPNQPTPVWVMIKVLRGPAADKYFEDIKRIKEEIIKNNEVMAIIISDKNIIIDWQYRFDALTELWFTKIPVVEWHPFDIYNNSIYPKIELNRLK